MDTPAWQIQVGEGPLVAAALHAGHAIRGDLMPRLVISRADRLREEDPFTDGWTAMAPTRIVGLRSRFEFDLNRPPEQAVYLEPSDAWGLSVWATRPPDEEMVRSRRMHAGFYAQVRHLFEMMLEWHRQVVVFDLHSYNHRRRGPDGPADDAAASPEVNVGTGTMDRRAWGPVVDRCIAELRDFDFLGRRLDVRENVKFLGGYFSRWVHETFPGTVCAISLEFKKFFMDEWTGRAYSDQLAAIGRALERAAEGVEQELVQRGCTSAD